MLPIVLISFPVLNSSSSESHSLQATAIYDAVSKPAVRPEPWKGLQPAIIVPQLSEDLVNSSGSSIGWSSTSATDITPTPSTTTAPSQEHTSLSTSPPARNTTPAAVAIVADTNILKLDPTSTVAHLQAQLEDAMKTIVKKGVACFHPKWVNTVLDLRRKRFEFALNDIPSLVYPFCSDSSSLGNWLGLYLNEASCALITGGHLISPPLGFGWVPQNTTGDQDAFFNALPTVITNPNPLNYTQVMDNMARDCACPRYCWDDPAASMFKNTPWIAKTVKRSIDAYLATVNISRGTELSPSIDLTNRELGTHLPLIPDVAIQYRCGDNMGYGNIGYGVLPFRAFASAIPSNAKYIYVLTDPPKRAGNHPYVHHCQKILTWLFAFITENFPEATVIVKKGGDIYLDFARLAYANTTICSASTFCLFPAIANNGSIVYYPSTKLIGVPPGNYKMNDHFYWITDPQLVTDVWKPWYLIEYALKNKPILPTMIEGHLLKGHGKQVYFILNQTKYSIPNGDTFEGLGFSWDDVWQMDEATVNLFPDSGAIPGCDGKSCLGSIFYQKKVIATTTPIAVNITTGP